MSQVKFIGCLHFRHPFIATNIRGFKDVYEHDEYLIEEYNKVVHKKDLVYILGDITMETSEHYYLLDQLNGSKKVVLGNHDRSKDVLELLKYVDEVGGMVKYKGYILTHCPIHPNEVHFFKGNIHAHIHENKLHELKVKDNYDDKGSKKEFTLHKYWNVDAKQINYQPKTIKELKQFYE